MKTQHLLIISLLFVSIIAQANKLKQTVRGTILDTDSKLPLIGATVVIKDSNPIIGTSTDVDGRFHFKDVPIGRIALEVTYLGYESKTIPNVNVNSGKETVLNLSLQESIEQLDEITVKSKRKNGEPLNEMALISATAVSAEQTDRYAGTYNDPSRILSNFAGVTSTQDGSNDIIVRGNSPKYIQWRLEGVEITNPNHFEDQNSASGGISALNNTLLSTSDFYTGAFTAEYGNVLSGVYDVKLRTGNNEKFESTFGFGIMGTDFTVEGPFKKGYTGSYVLNYRYSTVTLIKDLGLIDIDGVFNFQDVTGKIVLPTKRLGTFSMFVLGGKNNFEWADVKRNMWSTPGDRSMSTEISEDFFKDNHLLNTGINHTLPINKNSFLKTTLSYSTTGISDDIYERRISQVDDGTGQMISDTSGRTLNYTGTINKHVYRSAMKYSNKLNAKNKIQIGSRYSLYAYENQQSMLDETLTNRMPLVQFDESIATLNNYISWKHRFNSNITLVTGLHNMNVLLNNKSTLEPRVSFNWKLNGANSIHGGYGNHSNMERIHNYFTQVRQDDGSYTTPNEDLDLLKAHHFVLGYKRRITENVVGKIEAYYQHLYNLPVENLDTSYYATINEGLEYKYVDLVNEGTGKNYGIELTLERYFDRYYYLFNVSLYESKYKSLEGVERNTMYNGNYLMNLLCGREFENLGKKQNKTLSINAKIFYGGGRKIIPLLRDNNGELAVDPATGKYWDYKKAYDSKIEDAYNITLSASYKINKEKTTHELFLNLDNVTNAKKRITEYYDENEDDNIGYMQQFGFFPNLMYRVYF